MAKLGAWWPMRGDRRSRRIAVVADAVVNPAAGDPTGLAALTRRAGAWSRCARRARTTRRGRLAPIVDQVVTFLDDGYLVALGWPGDERTERLIEALSATGRRIERRIDLLD